MGGRRDRLAIGAILGVPLDRANRVLVNPDLSIPGHGEAFVIGDLASLMQDGTLVPGVAPAAMQEAHHAAENILRSIRGETTLPFRYHRQRVAGDDRSQAAVRSLARLSYPAWSPGWRGCLFT